MRTLLLIMAAGVLAATPVLAGDCCTAPAACGPEACCPAETCGPAACDPCGGDACCDPSCTSCCRKVCRVVCDTKKVKKVIWQVKCEDFCPQLPGCGALHKCIDCGGKGCGSCAEASCCEDACCEETCGTSCCEDVCASVRKANAESCVPRCGKVRCKKRLLRKEIECEVPTYKCVVVCVDPRGGCGTCVEGGAAAPAEAPADAEKTESAPLPPVVGTSYLK